MTVSRIRKTLFSTLLASAILLSYPASLQAEAAAELTQTEQDALPMDPSVMKPWINSEVIGMVTEDTKADVKDDFYLAVNRDWILNAKLRPGYTSETEMVHGTMAEVEKRCIGLASDKTLTGWDAEIVQTYYDLWLDWDARNEAGLTPVLPVVEKLDAVENLDDMTEFFLSDDSFSWDLFPARLNCLIARSDSSTHEVNIKPCDVILWDASAYEDPEYMTYGENGEFGASVSYMMDRLGRWEDAQTVIRNALEFDAMLAEYKLTYEEENDAGMIGDMANLVTMEDLKELSPDFPLCEYMEKYGWGHSDVINLEEPQWLTGLNEVYTEENLDKIRDWALAKFLNDMIQNIDEEAFRMYQDFQRQAEGIDESQPDEELAYEECMGNFPDEFARLYIEKYITPEDREEIRALCQEIIDTYREMLSETEWLSDEMREKAVQKLDKMAIWPLYPDKWVDESVLHITPKEEGGSYAQAVQEFARGVNEIYISDINKPVDPDIWEVEVLQSNASYQQKKNAFCIMAGFLGDAVWRSDMTIEEKYGKLGCVIGHEISHAFDTNGAQYDENGTFNDWWTPEDRKVFEERSKKAADWFNQVAAFDDGTAYPGNVVVAEAIADMGGMKCILKMAEKIEGFDYDRFFRANAVMWARIDTLTKARNMLGSDVHPFNYLRVNSTLQQFDKFLETYDIKEGDGMYLAPEERIAVW